jgi:1-acyl-sn-glycerol-3-phosphate acyltransferase
MLSLPRIRRVSTRPQGVGVGSIDFDHGRGTGFALVPMLVRLACPRRLKYLARHDLFFWLFSWWIHALGAVPIDRQRGAHGGMKTTLKLLQQHEAVLVLPEGSRTFDGQLQPTAAARRITIRAIPGQTRE